MTFIGLWRRAEAEDNRIGGMDSCPVEEWEDCQIAMVTLHSFDQFCEENPWYLELIGRRRNDRDMVVSS